MMLKYLHTIFIILVSLILVEQLEAHSTPISRLRPAQSFWGILFCSDYFTETYENVSREQMLRIIDQIQPDYITVDCKGHRGLVNYPSKLGNVASEFRHDPFNMFREVTAAHGVVLYCYFSGVLDAAAVRQHPDWAVQDVDGKPGGADGRATSVFGPYLHELLIPQLKELNDAYGFDGFWIDGECWAVERDFSPAVMEKFRNQTGIQTIPRKPSDPYWFEYSEFCRDGFRQYLQYYVTELHRHQPHLHIASNWAYSSFMPEAVNIGVDYLSGDIVPVNSINAARLESRVLAQQGKPWDLMAWSYTMNWDAPDGFQSPKTAIQLQLEAAQVISQGGGFQVYLHQNADSAVNFFDLNVIAEVAAFCRERQPYCHQAVSVPQIGLILSTDAYYQKTQNLFWAKSGELNGLKGILQMLLESQQVVDVVMEHHLAENINRYPLLIYPEWETIAPAFKKQLVQYVENGGNLIVMGPAACQWFQSELSVQWLDSLRENINYLAFNEKIASVKSISQRVQLAAEVIPFGKIYSNRHQSGDARPAASIRQIGKGRLAGVYLNLGARYLNGKVTVARDFMVGLVKTLFPNTVVTVEGSHSVDLCLNRIDNKLLLHLLNTAGLHDNPNVYVYDDIPPLGRLQITVRLEQKPGNVSLAPSRQKLAFTYRNGSLMTVIPSLKLYEILIIEE
ncbi:hypothetical protein JW964_23815 [candidate division KSB1 bacterium]|nr:hypothetical protein [candidate division KSB1 bacterium]